METFLLPSVLKAISVKKVDDIYLNIGHFLDHFMMLILPSRPMMPAAFGISYDEIIVYGVAGFVLFGGMAPVAAQLADKFSPLLMVIFHFGIGALPFWRGSPRLSGNWPWPSA